MGDQPPESLSAPEKEAWWDGWKVASSGAQNRPRPNYPTDKERTAFDLGWKAWHEYPLNWL